MLETLELRERLKEFSRLSVAAATKHRNTTPAETMKKERDMKQWPENGERERKREREGAGVVEGNSNVVDREERMVV